MPSHGNVVDEHHHAMTGENLRHGDDDAPLINGSAFQLKTFGRFSLTLGGAPVDIAPGKLAGLLTVLAMSTHMPCRRDWLTELFWGTHFELQSRQNLRQALSRLRRLVGDDVLVTDERCVRLRPRAIDVDALRFETLVTTGEPRSIRTGLDLLAGEFLADISIGQDAWDRWLSGHRRKLGALALEAFVKIGATALEEEDGQGTLDAATRAMAIDDLHETANRLMISALAMLGRRSDAFSAFERFKSRLRLTHGLEPDAAMIGLVESLRRSGSSARRAGSFGPLATAVGKDEGSVVSPPLPNKPSIAVLPFDLVGDAEQQYFADGLAEGLIVAMSRLRWLFVISSRSSFIFKGRAVDAQEIGRALGVVYVLEGRISIESGLVRVTTELIHAESGITVMANRTERDRIKVFELQDELVEQIAAAIEPGIRLNEIERVRTRPTSDRNAYDLYLRALSEMYKLREDGFTRAVALLEDAILLDPEYAEALTALADCRVRQWSNGWLPTAEGLRVQDEAVALAQRAVTADPRDGLALAVLAYALVVCKGRFEEALLLVDRAQRLQPNSDYVLALCGQVVVNAGQSDRAIALFEKARRLNPVDPRAHVTLNGIAMAHFHAGRFDDAERWARLALAERPDWNVAQRYRAAALAHLGREEEAKAAVAELLRRQPNSSLRRSRMSNFQFAYMYEQYLGGLAKAGLPEKAEEDR